MSAVITVFKSEANLSAELLKEIQSMSADFKVIGDAYAFTPAPGNLYNLLNLVKENGIAYRTHFADITGLKKG